MLLFTPILQQVIAKQPGWFSRKNRRVFGDVRYAIVYGKRTGNRYLRQTTYAWTDMFGAPKRLHYRLSIVEDDLTIGRLLDVEFSSIGAVNTWLKKEAGI